MIAEYGEILISSFSCSLNINKTSYSMENMAFDHLLRWKMIYTTNCPILTYAFLFKGWESVLFELGSERVEQIIGLPIKILCLTS